MGLVGELLKYGGSGMVGLLEQLFSVVWHEEVVPIGNGERALSFTYLRKGIERILGITEVLHY